MTEEMTINKGWVKLHRSLEDHWLWKQARRFSKAEAWIDLLLKANHQDNKSVKGMSLIEVKRGQVLTSQLRLAERWRWNRKTVKKFLLLLQNDEMIRFETDKGGDNGYTLITILNYDKLQNKQNNEMDNEKNNERVYGGTTEGQRIPTNKNGKNEKNDKNITTNVVNKPLSNVTKGIYKFREAYKKTFNKEYLTYKNEVKTFASVLKIIPLEEVYRLIDKFFAIAKSDSFIAKSTCGIGVFCSQINKLQREDTDHYFTPAQQYNLQSLLKFKAKNDIK